MKKLIFLCFSLFLALAASAQMSVKENSFRAFSDRNRAAGADMGVTDMTAETIEWPTDADGNNTLGLLIVDFENMAPDDIKQVTASLSKGLIVAKTEDRLINGKLYRWYFIPEGKGVDITLTHPRFGSTRQSNVTIKKKNIYELTVRNAATTNVAITSEPAGAKVYFDTQMVGVTPVTVPNVMMGLHKVALESPDPSMANSQPETTIEVSTTASAFNYPLYKSKTITFTADPANSMLVIERNGKPIASGTGSVTITDAAYGPYKVTGRYQEAVLEQMINVDDNFEPNFPVKVIGSKSVSFFAKQNSLVQNGATVNINGTYAGTTPLTKVLDYGTYEVDMSYAGYHKSKRLKVDKNTTECMIKLPTRKSVAYNPFEIDYHKRQWGIAVNYINRYYTYKEKGRKTKCTWIGEDGTNSGVQAGIVYQPYFGYGQGLSTGLFWQGTFGKCEENPDLSYQEHALYMPIEYQFRLPLLEDLSVFLNTGIGLTLGVSNTWKFDGDTESYDVGYGHNEDYDTYHPDSFDYSFLVGGGIQWKSLQIEAKYSMGLKNHDVMLTGDDPDITYKSGFWSVGLSLMF